MLIQDTVEQHSPKIASTTPIGTATKVAPEKKKSLSELAQSFCHDARRENVKYLIRSNTSHDGE